MEKVQAEITDREMDIYDVYVSRARSRPIMPKAIRLSRDSLRSEFTPMDKGHDMIIIVCCFQLEHIL